MQFDRFNQPLSRQAALSGLALAVLGSLLPTDAHAVPSEGDLDAARAQLEEIGREYQGIQEEIEQLTADLSATVQKIQETQEKLGVSQGELAQLVASGYKDGGMSITKVLLGSESFDDLISGLFYLNKMSDAQIRTIDEVKALQTELENQQAEQSAAMDDAEERLAEQADNQQRASELVSSLSAQVRAELEAEAAANAAVQAGLESASGQGAEDGGEESSGNSGSTGDAGQDSGANSGSDSSSNAGSNSPSNPNDSNDSNSSNSSGGTSSQGGGSSSGGSSSGGSHNGASTVGTAALNIAYQFEGLPYGHYNDPSYGAMDCSGLVQYCYKQLGYSIPRTTSGQMSYFQKYAPHWTTSKSELRVGDVCFFPGHVAFYEGGGSVFGARKPGVGASSTGLQYFTFLGAGQL